MATTCKRRDVTFLTWEYCKETIELVHPDTEEEEVLNVCSISTFSIMSISLSTFTVAYLIRFNDALTYKYFITFDLYLDKILANGFGFLVFFADYGFWLRL